MLIVDDSASLSITAKLPEEAAESTVLSGRPGYPVSCPSMPPLRCRELEDIELLRRLGVGSELGGPTRPLLSVLGAFVARSAEAGLLDLLGVLSLSFRLRRLS